MGNLVDKNGDLVSDGLRKAQMLNKFFASVFTKENTNEILIFEKRCGWTVLRNFEITVYLVEKHIKQLNALK